MQKFTQKYCLVAFLEKIEEGTVFPYTNWPLHVTIAGVFAIPVESSELINRLTSLLEKQELAMATAAQDEYFGPEQRTQVTVLNMSQELITLHQSVITMLKSAGALFNDPDFIGDGYRAHVTVQAQSRLEKGELANIAEISLVDMFPNNDGHQRKVLKTIKLN